MKKTILTFGVLAGALIFAYSYITIAILGDFSHATPRDLEMAQWLGYIRYLLLLLGVITAMVTYRRSTPGPIGYRRVFVLGLLVSLVVAFFVGAMEYIYIAFTNPHFYERYAALMIEGLKQKGASAAKLAALRREQQAYAWMASPLATGAFYFVETSVIGTIFSLILPLFFRRSDGTTTSSEGRPALDGPT